MEAQNTKPLAIVFDDGQSALLETQLQAVGFYVEHERLDIGNDNSLRNADLVVISSERTDSLVIKALFRRCCWDGIPVFAVGNALEHAVDFFGRNELVETRTSSDGKLLAFSHLYRPFHGSGAAVLRTFSEGKAVFARLKVLLERSRGRRVP